MKDTVPHTPVSPLGDTELGVMVDIAVNDSIEGRALYEGVLGIRQERHDRYLRAQAPPGPL
jgi:hypothetical protein